jgi:hypothetical protein
MVPRLDNGGAEDSEGAQISGGAWEEVKLGIVFGLRSVCSFGPYKYMPSRGFGLSPKIIFQFRLLYNI